MKRLLLITAVLVLSIGNIFAQEVQYNMQVGGITCSACVATSAKALKKIDGVKAVGSDLEKGLITVCADEKVQFTNDQLAKLFLDKGFTFRGMEKQNHCDPA